jgi:hypothetical protein
VSKYVVRCRRSAVFTIATSEAPPERPEPITAQRPRHPLKSVSPTGLTWMCVRLQFNDRPELRYVRGNRSGPSVYVGNNSRRELHGIFVRHNLYVVHKKACLIRIHQDGSWSAAYIVSSGLGGSNHRAHSHPLRPLLCAMQDAVDFNDLSADSVYDQKRQAWKYQFAGAHLVTRTTTVGKLREGANA